MLTNDTDANQDSRDHLDRLAFDLLDALRQPGCPVCRLTHQAARRYLDGISYEMVNDPDVRQELRDSLGYCAVHGQEWLRLQDALGTAIIYRDVLNHLLQTMQAQAQAASTTSDSESTQADNGLLDRLQNMLASRPKSEAGRALAEALEPASPCPVCSHTLKIEESLAASFAAALANRQFMEAYRRHEMGLCLPHFRSVLRFIAQPSLLRAATQAQAAKLAMTRDDLAEVIRKHDYRFTGESRGDEFNAPARSVEQVGGNLPIQLNMPK